MPARRRRRPAEESRSLILEAAERLLVEGGVAAVQVRAVGAKVGMTDAAINHHFGTREQLLEALLRHGGRRLRTQIDAIAETWASDRRRTVEQLVDALAAVYADGYAELALALHQAGWRDTRSGLLSPVVDVLHHTRAEKSREQGRPPPDRADTEFAIAAAHQALALEPILGRPFRRSVGMSSRASGGGERQREWWVRTLCLALDIPASLDLHASKES